MILKVYDWIHNDTVMKLLSPPVFEETGTEV